MRISHNIGQLGTGGPFVGGRGTGSRRPALDGEAGWLLLGGDHFEVRPARELDEPIRLASYKNHFDRPPSRRARR